MTRSSSAELPRTAKPRSASYGEFRDRRPPSQLRHLTWRRCPSAFPQVQESQTRNLESGQTGFRNRRHIGKLREPLFGGHPDQLELTAAYQRPTCSHKIELSFLNGNLMVPAGHPSIFSSDGNACGSRQPSGVTDWSGLQNLSSNPSSFMMT